MTPIGSGTSPPALILRARALARVAKPYPEDPPSLRGASATKQSIARRTQLWIALLTGRRLAPSRRLAMTVDADMISTSKSLNWFLHRPQELRTKRPGGPIHAARFSASHLHLGCGFDFRLGAVCSRLAATRRAAASAARAQLMSSSGSSNSRSGTRQNERSMAAPFFW
jgi:hypothetical protein